MDGAPTNRMKSRDLLYVLGFSTGFTEKGHHIILYNNVTEIQNSEILKRAAGERSFAQTVYVGPVVTTETEPDRRYQKSCMT